MIGLGGWSGVVGGLGVVRRSACLVEGPGQGLWQWFPLWLPGGGSGLGLGGGSGVGL